jgi:Flp pilus assembly protein TadG
MRYRPSSNPGAGLNAGQPSAARHAKRRSGLASVEFAMVLPFLGFIILGMFELNQAMISKVILSDAARKGCRVGVLPGGMLDSNKTGAIALSITQNIDNILTDNGVPLTNRVITVKVNGTEADPINAVPGDQISVEVKVPVSDLYYGTSFFLPSAVMESGSIVMMRQG